MLNVVYAECRYAVYHYAECRCAECHIYKPIMLSVFYAECHIYKPLMQNVVMLNVIMPSVVAPLYDVIGLFFLKDVIWKIS
jgi:hypothetical protein